MEKKNPIKNELTESIAKRTFKGNLNQNFTILVALFVVILSLFFVLPHQNSKTLPSSVSFSELGSTTLVPDTIRVSAYATTVSKSSVTTLAKLSDVANAMREVLVRNNVMAADFSSANLSLYPEYSYAPNGNRNLLGYRGSQNFEIIVKNVKSAGVIVDQLVAASDNQLQINSISSFVLDSTQALKMARKEAMEKATIKAQEYARLANKRLGKILSISENTNLPVMQPLAMAKEASGTSFDLGSTKVEVSLSISFQID